MATNTVVVSLQALLLVPLYLRTLGARLYGAWLGSGDILNLLQLFDLGLTNVVTQRIGAAHARNDHDAIGEYFGSAILVMTLIGALLAGATLVVSFFIARLVHVTGADADVLIACFRLASIATFFFVANFSVLGLARGTQETTLQNIGTVAGSLTGLLVSAFLLLHGAGLWSIAIGLCVRTGVALVVSIVFVLIESRKGSLRAVRISRRALRDLMTTSPATTLSGIGYLLTTQTEAMLVAAFVGPEMVPVLMLTRRAIDIASGVLNSLAYSSYAGFAHLVESPERDRAREVMSEIDALWVALALAAATVFLVVNPSLVPLWAGDKVFGGSTLTLLLAAQMMITGRSQVMYYLYRAAGAIVPGSMLQFYESVIRVVVTIALLKTIGIAGPAISTLIVTLPFTVLTVRRTHLILDGFASPASGTAPTVWLVRLALAGMAIAACYSLTGMKWPALIAASALVGSAAVLVQLVVDARLTRIRVPLEKLITR